MNPALPAAADVGESDITDGDGVLTVNDASDDAPPPGAGLTTLIATFCPAAISDALMEVESWVPLMELAERLFPFHRMVEVERKLFPVIVSVNPGPPAVAEDGEKDEMDGTPLLVVKVDA